MNDKIYQEVLNLLQDFLPKNWTNTILYVGYTKGSYSMKYYCKTGEGDFIDCFNLEGISKGSLIKLFVNIDKVLSKERTSMDEKNKWSILTMLVDNDGEMRTEFDYEDHSEDMIAFENEWKKKYL